MLVEAILTDKTYCYFFPQAFPGVCNKELCAVRDNIGQYAKLNAVV
jgi:peroxiredoxin